MSVQYGRWNFDGQPPATDHIEKVRTALAPYGPDSNELYSKSGISIVYRAFHTTNESHREKQPHTSPSGAVITWDGRLDNRADLIDELRDPLTVKSTDVAIVAEAYEKWGANCLDKLIGDWGLSIWDPRERFVLLAKDPIGTKHLYYTFDNKHLAWSTILDPLVLFAGKTFEICEEYIAGWLSYFPATHVTPYVGIHSVPPSSYVLLRPGTHITSKYWDFDPGKRIRYGTDAEYEEHFRSALTTAVQRRLRSDRPILAELSGGMDSSSIICIADTFIAHGGGDNPRLDTISWYDDSHKHIEPDTNDLSWITKVEEKRGRTGCHIDLPSLKSGECTRESVASEFDNDRFSVIPPSNNRLTELFKRYAAYMRSQGHRVTLSGIGGDEVTHGEVPTPIPELQNLMARARFSLLANRLNAWATKMTKPRLSLFWEASRGFFSLPRTGVLLDLRRAPWFHSDFVRRNYAALCGYPSRIKIFGALPSFQESVATLNVLRRIVATCALQGALLREIRLPYLDRDLLEFLYAIPREQIVGVGKRRFLMKRALVGIVPDEVLNRRRKAFVPKESLTNSSSERPYLSELGQKMVGSSLGIIDSHRFFEMLWKAQHNEEGCTGPLRRTLRLESWLRHLTLRGVLTDSTCVETQSYSSTPEPKTLSSGQPRSSAG